MRSSVAPRAIIPCLFFVLLFACAADTRAASAVPVSAAAVGEPEGLELTNGWVFERGDNPEWASPSYDDSAWEGVDPSLRNGPIPTFEWDGKAWFRLHIDVEPGLLDRPLVLAMTQAGASEVYLDGVLIRRFGAIEDSALAEREYNPDNVPGQIVFAGGSAHVLAVRYSCKSAPYVLRGLDSLRPVRSLGYGFTAAIRSGGEVAHATWQGAMIGPAIHFGVAAFALGLAVCHFVIYFALARKRPYFHFSLYAIWFGVFLMLSFAQANGHLGLKATVGVALALPLLYLVMGAAYQSMLNSAFTPDAPKGVLVFLAVAVAASIIPLAVPAVTRIMMLVMSILTIWMYVRMFMTLRAANEESHAGMPLLTWALVAWIAVPVMAIVGPVVRLPASAVGLFNLAGLLLMLILPSIYLIQRVAVRHHSVQTQLAELKAIWVEKSAAGMKRPASEES